MTRRSKRTISLGTILFFAVIASGCTGGGGSETTKVVEEATPSANVETKENAKIETAVVEPASYATLLEVVAKHRGKVVVVDFWSTSCIPCMRELPKLVELADMHPEKVECISFNLDYIGLKKKPAEKYLGRVQEFLTEIQSDITNFLSTDTDEFVIQQLEAGALPAVAMFNQSGELVKVLTDSNTGEDGLTYEGAVIPLIEQLISSDRN